MRSAGVQFSRENFSWATIEPTPGRLNWSGPDRLMRVAATQGLEIVPLIWGSPTWAAGTWNVAPLTSATSQAYANFVREVVTRYGSNGTFWTENPGIPRDPTTYYDLWNEPYYPAFWASGPDPAAYARMFRQAVTVARGADPSARFLLEANTSSYTSGAPSFLPAMFNAVPNLGSYASGLSVHPYASDGRGPAYCTRYTPSRGAGQDWHSTLYETCRIEDERRILNMFGATNVKLWITEVGWSTTQGAPNSVTAMQQAAYIRTLFTMLRGQWRGLVAAVQWYQLEDAPPTAGRPADGYGLLRGNGTAKPSWTAFQEQVAQGL